MSCPAYQTLISRLPTMLKHWSRSWAAAQRLLGKAGTPGATIGFWDPSKHGNQQQASNRASMPNPDDHLHKVWSMAARKPQQDWQLSVDLVKQQKFHPEAGITERKLWDGWKTQNTQWPQVTLLSTKVFSLMIIQEHQEMNFSIINLHIGYLKQYYWCSSVSGSNLEWIQKLWVSLSLFNASKTFVEKCLLLLQHLFSEDWQGYQSCCDLAAFVLGALADFKPSQCAASTWWLFLFCVCYYLFFCHYLILDFTNCFHHLFRKKAIKSK